MTFELSLRFSVCMRECSFLSHLRCRSVIQDKTISDNLNLSLKYFECMRECSFLFHLRCRFVLQDESMSDPPGDISLSTWQAISLGRTWQKIMQSLRLYIPCWKLYYKENWKSHGHAFERGTHFDWQLMSTWLTVDVHLNDSRCPLDWQLMSTRLTVDTSTWLGIDAH